MTVHASQEQQKPFRHGQLLLIAASIAAIVTLLLASLSFNALVWLVADDTNHLTFTSYLFIFGFMPVCYTVVRAARALTTPNAIAIAIIGTSLTFYSTWGFPSLAVLLVSIFFNFSLRQLMVRSLTAQKV